MFLTRMAHASARLEARLHSVEREVSGTPSSMPSLVSQSGDGHEFIRAGYPEYAPPAFLQRLQQQWNGRRTDRTYTIHYGNDQTQMAPQFQNTAAANVSNYSSTSSFSLTLSPTQSMIDNRFDPNLTLDYEEMDIASVDSAGARHNSSTYTDYQDATPEGSNPSLDSSSSVRSMPYMPATPVMKGGKFKGKGYGSNPRVPSTALPVQGRMCNQLLEDILDPGTFGTLRIHLQNIEASPGVSLATFLGFAGAFHPKIRPELMKLFGRPDPWNGNRLYIDLPGFREGGPYFLENESYDDTMDVDNPQDDVQSPEVTGQNPGSSASTPYVQTSTMGEPNVTEEPPPNNGASDDFAGGPLDLWRDCVIHNIRVHVPNGPVDEELHFTDPAPLIPANYSVLYCSSLYRELCLLYHSLPEEKKVGWRRARIRASSNDMLIRAYQDLRQRLIEDGGVLPVAGERTSLPRTTFMGRVSVRVSV